MKHFPWAALRRALTRFDRDKIHPPVAIRNTIGVVLPLVIAEAMGQRSLGLVGALGALNVAYSDGQDAVGPRARRMLLASGLIAVALFAGGLTGHHNATAIAVATLCAFGAGMLISLGTAAGDIGTVSLVTLVVFAARPLTPAQAALAGLVAWGGALLQTALSILLEPVRGHAEHLRVLAAIFGELSRLAIHEIEPGTAPPSTSAFSQAHDVLSSLRPSPENERVRSLLSQAERIRLRALALSRMHRRLRRDRAAIEEARLIDRFRTACSEALASLSNSLQSRTPVGGASGFSHQAEGVIRAFRTRSGNNAAPLSVALLGECARLMDALAGQIRSAERLADSSDFTAPLTTTPADASTGVMGTPRRVLTRIGNYWEVLSANLTMRSAAFRHAIRLAACVAVGDAIGRSVDWQRSYWIPMTIAIVLKPDFLSTYSRGVLRLAGTFVGLIVATLLYYALPAGTLSDVIFVGVFTLMLRWIGPANYGIFVIAVSGLVVALIANTGVAPRVVIPLRALNTAIGGALALAAYAVWPTWERTQFRESFAQLLDSYRAYLRAVMDRFASAAGGVDDSAVDRDRQSARVARTNAEASADRIGMEPGASPEVLSLTAAILASSHDFIYAVMTLEGATLPRAVASGTPIVAFLNQVDLTLYLLETAVRHASPLRPRNPDHFPDLRAAHRILMASIAATPPLALLDLETDRITNALNTMREQALRWLRLQRTGHVQQ